MSPDNVVDLTIETTVYQAIELALCENCCFDFNCDLWWESLSDEEKTCAADKVPEFIGVQAEFSADPTMIAQGDTVNFTDESTNDPTNYGWSFGDGGNSDEKNPSYVYAAPGIYDVTLVAAKDGSGDVETKPGLICVSAPTSLSLDFDGATNYLTVPSSPDYNFGNGDFTLTAWIRVDNFTGNKSVLGMDNAPAGRRQWQFGLLGGNMFILTGNVAGSLQAFQQTTTAIPDNDWHLLIAKKIGAQFFISLDAVPQPLGSLSGSHAAMGDQGDPLYIGAKDSGGITQLFDGKIANIALFNIGFTPAEELELYNSGTQLNIATFSRFAECVGAWNGGTEAMYSAPTLTVPDVSNLNNATSDNMDLSNIDPDIP